MTDTTDVPNVVIESINNAITASDMDEDIDTQLTKVLGKLASELNEVQFVPSPELVALAEELVVLISEDEDPDFIPNDDFEDDDTDEDDEV